MTGVETQFFQRQTQEQRAARLRSFRQKVGEFRSQLFAIARQGIADHPCLELRRKGWNHLSLVVRCRISGRRVVGSAGDRDGVGTKDFGLEQFQVLAAVTALI